MDGKESMLRKKPRIRRWISTLLFILAGMGGGFLYYRYVGCVTGSCAITSNPYVSTIYGGVIGALLGVAIMPNKKLQEEKQYD